MENVNFLFVFSVLNTEVGVDDLINVCVLVLGVFSGVLAIGQWKHNLRLQRSMYLENLIEKFRSDKDLVEMIYRIDKNEKWYNKEFHNGKTLEQQVDRLLTYLSYLCYLKENKVIKPKEFDFIKYNIDRTLRDQSTQDYLFNLVHFSRREKADFPFPLLLKYAKENGFIKEDFWNEGNPRFQHIMIPA